MIPLRRTSISGVPVGAGTAGQPRPPRNPRRRSRRAAVDGLAGGSPRGSLMCGGDADRRRSNPPSGNKVAPQRLKALPNPISGISGISGEHSNVPVLFPGFFQLPGRTEPWASPASDHRLRSRVAACGEAAALSRSFRKPRHHITPRRRPVSARRSRSMG